MAFRTSDGRAEKIASADAFNAEVSFLTTKIQSLKELCDLCVFVAKIFKPILLRIGTALSAFDDNQSQS